MKFETLLKSAMIAALFTGVVGTEVNAAKAKGNLKETGCKDLIVDLTNFDYKVDLDYQPCGADAQHKTLSANKSFGTKEKPIRVGGNSEVGMEQCLESEKCPGGHTQHIFPLPLSASGKKQPIGTGLTITCVVENEAPSCTFDNPS